LSFYGDSSLGRILRTPLNQLLQARQELIDWNLIAYEAPLAQVLSLPNKPERHVANSPLDGSKAMTDSYQQLVALLATNRSVNNKEHC